MTPCTYTVLMIRPACFGFNNETAPSNAFQQPATGNVQKKAIKEFDSTVDLLSSNGMQVMVVHDLNIPLPDSVFPNNWFSTHHDGTVIIYPLHSEIRRREKRMDIFQKVLPEAGFSVQSIHDLSAFEKEHQFCEGTGSMVMDHENKIIYACRSPRTFEDPLKKVSALLHYDYILFNALLDGKAIYHTNVMMAIGKGFAVICKDAIENAHQKNVIHQLSANRELIVITVEQLKNMAGNMLMTLNSRKEQLCLLSKTAYDSLQPHQKKHIEKFALPVICNIPTIEKTGGGSIRCMMAEIFLPKRNQS